MFITTIYYNIFYSKKFILEYRSLIVDANKIDVQKKETTGMILVKLNNLEQKRDNTKKRSLRKKKREKNGQLE